MALVLSSDARMVRDTAMDFFPSKSPVTEFRKLRDSNDPDGFSRKLWQDMADLGAYYEGHGKVDGFVLPAKAADGSAKAAELVKKGACVSCHGDNFSKPIDPSYPKIAGQYGDYLYVALKAYKTEGNPQVGRANGVMGGVAKQFSNAELKELANYVSAQQGDLKTVPQSKFR